MPQLNTSSRFWVVIGSVMAGALFELVLIAVTFYPGQWQVSPPAFDALLERLSKPGN